MKQLCRACAGISPQVHAWSLGLCVAVSLACLGLFLAWADTPVWEGWQASGELHRPVYGEQIFADSIFRTRANTWSNLAYVFVGIYIMVIGIFDWRRSACGEDAPLCRRPAMGILFGLACCYLGVGSGIFHASLTRWGQQLDVAAMYSPLVVLIALNGDRRFPAWGLWTLAAIISSALLYWYKWSMSSTVVLPALILAVVVLMILDRFRAGSRFETRWILFATLSLIAAFLFRQLDVDGNFTGPDSWLQGHVFWHIFTATGLACAYGYYRSERTVPIAE